MKCRLLVFIFIFFFFGEMMISPMTALTVVTVTTFLTTWPQHQLQHTVLGEPVIEPHDPTVQPDLLSSDSDDRCHICQVKGQRFNLQNDQKKKNPIGRFRCVWFEFFFRFHSLWFSLWFWWENVCRVFFFPTVFRLNQRVFCDVGASYSLTYKNQSLQNPSAGMRTNITWPLRSINRNIVSVSSLEILALVVLAAPQIKDRRRRWIRTPCKQRVYQDGLSTPRERKKNVNENHI